MMKKAGDRLKRKLQIRFVLLAVAALVILQTMIIGFSTMRSYRQMTLRADHLIRLVGTQPDAPELAEAHWFDAEYHFSDKSLHTDLTHTALIQQEQAEAYAKQIISAKKDRGYLDGYRYLVRRGKSQIKVTFLSRATALEAWKTNTKTLVVISLSGIAVMAGILSAVSGIIVAPLVKNRQKQKEFITSASHGLKTPLTVIQADAQLLEVDLGENEWLKDILKQTSYMTEMMNRLVYLARTEEQDENTVKIEFPISDVAEDMTASYRSVAQSSGKNFETGIQPGLSYRGDEKAIRELMTVLLDNAFKYSTEGGSISAALSAEGKGIRFAVDNSISDIDPKQLENFTDRFYRADASGRVKGFGIGLSIAKAVAESHKGKLLIELPEADRIRITALLK